MKLVKFIIGLILIFGSIGAIEVGGIGMFRFVLQEIIGVLCLISGLAGIYSTK